VQEVGDAVGCPCDILWRKIHGSSACCEPGL
jgi:hypothetical protein